MKGNSNRQVATTHKKKNLSKSKESSNFVYICLNLIIESFGELDIRRYLLNHHLTLELIHGLNKDKINSKYLNLTAMQKEIMGKVWEKGHYRNLHYGKNCQLVLVLIHHKYRSMLRVLAKKILEKVHNCFIITEDLQSINNFMLEKKQIHAAPFAIIFPTKALNLTEMDLYLSICNIFYGHLHVQICAYSQAESDQVQLNDSIEKGSQEYKDIKKTMSKVYCKKEGNQMINFQQLLLSSNQLMDEEDNLQILLREEIPENCYINLLTERGGRISDKELGEKFSLRYFQNEDISGKILKIGNGINQLIIWVAVHGLPINQLLPELFKDMNSCSSRKEKNLKEERNILGFTRVCFAHIGRYGQREAGKAEEFQGQESIFTMNGDKIEQNLSDQMSMCFSEDEQNGKNPFLQKNKNEEKSLAQKTVIIIDLREEPKKGIQTCKTLANLTNQLLISFLKERKSRQQDQKVEKDRKYINEMSRILDLDPQLLIRALYLNKI